MDTGQHVVGTGKAVHVSGGGCANCNVYVCYIERGKRAIFNALGRSSIFNVFGLLLTHTIWYVTIISNFNYFCCYCNT